MIKHWSTKTGPYTRFYFGDIPDWFYISHNVPAMFSYVDKLITTVLSFKNSNDKANLIHIIGSVGSGKTTVALQALSILSRTQENIYNFIGVNGIHVEHLWSVIKDVKGLVVIYIDSAANHFYAVNNIIERALDSNTGCKICVITEDRSTQYYLNNRHLYQIPHKIIHKITLNTLDRDDASKLLEKADSLGVVYEKLKGLNNHKRIEKVISFDEGYKGDLLATLYDLSSGESYRDKLNDEYREILSPEAKSLYEMISLVTACKLPLPLNYLSDSENISVNTAMQYLKKDLDGKVHVREHGKSTIGITARHYTIAEFHLTKCFPKERIKDHILYAHDGVFWLQYGRFLEKDKQIPEALHCFRRGLDLYDSFQIRHALGHLLLKKYRTEGMNDEQEYIEGIQWLEGEIKTRTTDSYSYTTLCSELSKILEANPQNQHAKETLQKYVSIALNQSCFEDDALIRTVTHAMKIMNTPK